jgi:hypothetical protein
MADQFDFHGFPGAVCWTPKSDLSVTEKSELYERAPKLISMQVPIVH